MSHFIQHVRSDLRVGGTQQGFSLIVLMVVVAIVAVLSVVAYASYDWATTK
ncbi:MAG: prepilin-type N-terminal cleavage/methylation domain-containing protein, partial [Proteobacteria bacterium]|nr:prepilin-type N-terminal cleavage/methylation domain-containing protein [Pseudomonadota bacterium]